MASFPRTPALAMLMCCMWVGGCAAPATRSIAAHAPQVPENTSIPENTSTTPPEAIAADPIAYLRKVEANCRNLKQYTLVFVRQERQGFGPFRELGAPERIQCWFRREPFSIRMKWLDPDVKFGESTYVQGQQDDKVRFVPRHGLLGLQPGVVRVSLQTPVIWGEARYPITDFGLERLMGRTFATLAEAEGRGKVTYAGLTQLEETGQAAHHVRIEYPRDEFKTPVQELFFDARTDLPLATKVEFPDGTVDTAYRYDELNAGVALDDDDFLLEAERAQRAESASHANGE